MKVWVLTKLTKDDDGEIELEVVDAFGSEAGALRAQMACESDERELGHVIHGGNDQRDDWDVDFQIHEREVRA